eukprot:CAMPEP_0197277898 /NCGR_PEP_ID=MMETSP1432-20130617/17769_1 /TAXON_ID=44447 /ORGANISM="Pseudo-nitzschia delicatissima, Strain UNC1205" /LENGTH=80 /DNA_ID=CAMNT_0042744181 /DNA_START=3 /DNA_END=242 /DNA_ORIENTATION=+
METTPTDDTNGDDKLVKGSKTDVIDLSKDEKEPATKEKKPLKKNKAKKTKQKRNKSNTTKKAKSSNGTTKQIVQEPHAFA